MDSLPMNVIAFWIACFCIMIPLIVAFSTKSSKIKKFSLNPEDKKQRYYFLVWGMPIGISIGFLVHIPIVFDVLHLSQLWYFAVIQGLASIFFIPILIVIMGLRGMSFIIKTNISEKKKGISEGIFISFVAWQVALFFNGHYDVLIPGFSDSLQHMREYFANFTAYR